MRLIEIRKLATLNNKTNKTLKKTITLVMLAIIGLSVKAQTSVYHPFPDSNATWDYVWFDMNLIYNKYAYFINGDTVINLETYNKIYTSYNNTITYTGGLRESNKKIYYTQHNWGHEYMLYDFNINIVDTLKVLCDADTFRTRVIVTSIDSVLLPDMTYRKRFNFDAAPPWIEGMGSTWNLFQPGGMCCTCIWTWQLVCLTKTDTTLYSNTQYISCFTIDSENDLKINSGQIKVYPNPAIDYVTIESPLKSTILFSNIQGQLIKSLTTNGNKISVDVSALLSGVYVVEVKTEKGIEVKKFIKE